MTHFFFQRFSISAFLIVSLRQIESAITEFAVFWKEHEAEYRAQAAKIASTVALNLRGDRDAKKWQEICNAIASGVTATTKGNQLVISLPVVAANASIVITRGVLRAWVQAGERGEEGAKRLTSEDRKILNRGEAGMKQLLYRLGNAYYSNSPQYNGLRKAINQWASETDGGSRSPVKGIPPEVVNAIKAQWDEWFAVIVPGDLKAWMTKRAMAMIRKR